MQVVMTAFYNLAVVLLLSPLFDGIMRKTRAVIHSRQGPPILQPYYDLMKMFVKETSIAQENWIGRFAPLVCLISILAAALFTPVGVAAPFGFAGDAIVLVYLLTVSAICIMLGGMATGSTYAYIGSCREMMLILVVEPVLAITLITGAVKSGTLLLGGITDWYAAQGLTWSMVVAGIAFLLATQAEIGKVPFDLAEAETELMEGPMIEFSGPNLALFRWAFFGKRVIYASLFVEIFAPWPKTGSFLIDILLHLLKITIVLLIVELMANINPRLKINQAIPFFAGTILFALAGMAIAIIGG